MTFCYGELSPAIFEESGSERLTPHRVASSIRRAESPVWTHRILALLWVDVEVQRLRRSPQHGMVRDVGSLRSATKIARVP